MAKKAKQDFPPFQMIVDRGRLAPARPEDAERLDTWKNGSKVFVVFVRDGGRVMERKWYAICGRAVKDCKTPWKTQEEASDAMKMAVGVTNIGKTAKGNYFSYPKSLADLTDPELDDAVKLMIDVMYHVTGVDPAEWRKQTDHIKDYPPAEDPKGDDGGDGAAAEQESAGAAVEGEARIAEEAPQNASETAHEAVQSEAPTSPKRAPSSEVTADLSDEDREWLKTGARMLYGAAWKHGAETLAVQSAHLRSDFTPEGISVAARERMSTVMKHCKAVCFNEKTREEVLLPISMAACCEPEDVKTPDIKEG